MADRPRRSDRGTTLLLFPSAVLVLLLLAAIAVDLSQVHMARRELARAADQAADDAAAMIDHAEAHRTGRTRIDHAAADGVVRFELAVAHLHGRLVGTPQVTFDDPTGTVIVTASVDVEPVFGRVVGRGPERVTIEARGRLIDDG
jgi:Flp pilus assembly protein TadG